MRFKRVKTISDGLFNYKTPYLYACDFSIGSEFDHYGNKLTTSVLFIEYNLKLEGNVRPYTDITCDNLCRRMIILLESLGFVKYSENLHILMRSHRHIGHKHNGTYKRERMGAK